MTSLRDGGVEVIPASKRRRRDDLLHQTAPYTITWSKKRVHKEKDMPLYVIYQNRIQKKRSNIL